ncbi:flavin reductase [Streptomyces sp. F001]|uniref:flavin reductase family protein n=1 Tax=Streptomyces sp. F001 TaxID=1510026 RepID=UPI00101E5E20|nr:flavin reductase family protein [Streptomyces sp. F001]RZB17445.1 flavin reductase [Streptomyces sp. F001]
MTRRLQTSEETGGPRSGPLHFRQVAGCFPTGITLVSTLVNGEPHGMTANAFTTVSLDPLLVLVCVNRNTRMQRFIEASRVFAITVLAADQQDVSGRFADATRPTGWAAFATFTYLAAPATGCPVLRHGLAFFDCAVTDIHLAGDHCLVVGEALAFDELDKRPALVFVDGRYATLPRSWATSETAGHSLRTGCCSARSAPQT